ncbi:MAG: sulfite exporter TauE/SafE family protein [Pirellulaceae bacterium]
MPFTLLHLILVAGILSVSSFLQTIVGFGAGLLGIPLLLLAGFPPVQAVAVVTITSIIQSAIGSWKLRQSIRFPDTKRPILIRLLMLPIGALALWKLGQHNQQFVKQAIGLVLLLIVLVQWRLRIAAATKLHAGWEWGAFSTSGFLLGFCGMGGPVLGLWAVAHDWSPKRSRGFMFLVMFAGNIPVAIMHSILFGSQVGWGFLWGLYGLPWVLAGTLVGLAAGNSISKQRLRQVTLVVLALIGIQATVWPFFVDRPAEKKSNSGQPAAPAAGASAKEL